MSKDYAKTSRTKQHQSSKSGYAIIIVIIAICVIFYYAFSRGILVLKTNHADANRVINVKEKIPTKKAEPSKPRFEFYTLLSKEAVPVSHEKHPTADVTTDTIEPPKEKTTESTTTTTSQEPAIAPTGVPSVPIHHLPTGSSMTTAETVAVQQPSTTEPVQVSEPVTSTTLENAPSKPASTTQTAEKSRYVLQVAAIRQKNDAESLKAQLSFLGFDVFIEPFQIAGSQGYRVKIGPYSSLESVKKAQETLRRNHLSSILITLPS